jgi:pSer/pThr/pTyr-binding forkhead associated (FHA) protein
VIRLTVVIELEDQDPRGLTFESASDKIVIGRDDAADFQIKLSSLSRFHVRIVESDGIHVLEDLGSKHGTVLNGRKLKKKEKKVLRDGDIIELANAKVTVALNPEMSVSEAADGTRGIADAAVKKILHGEERTAFVKVLTGPEAGRRLNLETHFTEWILGRSRDCELTIDDPNISREHAKIVRDWRGYTVFDLGSKNGVVVNEKRVEAEKILRDKDEIAFGSTKIVFVNPDAKLVEGIQVPGFEIEHSVAQAPPEIGVQADGDEPVVGDPDATEAGKPETDAEDTQADDTQADGAPAPEALPDGITGLSKIDPELLDKVKPTSRLSLALVVLLAVFAVLLLAFVLLILV